MFENSRKLMADFKEQFPKFHFEDNVDFEWGRVDADPRSEITEVYVKRPEKRVAPDDDIPMRCDHPTLTK
jgi:hypothetical protein